MPPISRKLSAGKYLFKEGENPHCMYYIKKGVVSIRKRKGSLYIELAQLGPGEVFGELGFFDQQTRSGSALCLTRCEFLELSYESMEDVYRQVPDYLKTIMTCIVERLRKSDEVIRRFSEKSVAEHDLTISPDLLKFRDGEQGE